MNRVTQAEDNLQFIRDSVSRARALSNFSGLSSILAGCAAIFGAFTQRILVMPLPATERVVGFVINWLLVVALSLIFDYWHVSRRSQDLSVAVRLVKSTARAAWPPLVFASLLTASFIHEGRLDLIYPYWMLAYGCAVCAAGNGGAKELTWLGRSFLACGAAFLLFQSFGPQAIRNAQIGLAGMLPSFGLLNIGYGLVVGRKVGW